VSALGSTGHHPGRVSISADAALSARWAAERQRRQLSSPQLLARALDALAVEEGSLSPTAAAEVELLERRLTDERARVASLRDELASARAHLDALRQQLRRDTDEAIDPAAPDPSAALTALWEATHLPELLLWRRGDGWADGDEIPAHHRLVITAIHRRLQQLLLTRTAAAALAFSRLVRDDLRSLLLSETGLAGVPYHSPSRALSFPSEVVGAVRLAREIRGLGPEPSPYGDTSPPEKPAAGGR
jgi:hypothetical protein